MHTSGLIGNYVVDRELGRGGMGVVYAAKHRVLGRPAAIKLLLANEPERIERFFNEARAAMAIDHPGIVKIYDVGVAADGRAYIAMELLAGQTLQAQLARGPLPLRFALEHARRIAAALVAAHEAGVIHRDLKPDNIFIDRENQLKLVDFGIAKLAQPLNVRTATGAVIGTPAYMSPEQCEGLRQLDARTDLYSLGCVLYAMLTGRPPFEDGGTAGIIASQLSSPVPPLRSRCPSASQALADVVHRLLAKSPDERYRDARAALEALSDPAVERIESTGDAAMTADAIVPMGQRTAAAQLSQPVPQGATTAASMPPTYGPPTGLAPTGLAPMSPQPHGPSPVPAPTGLAPISPVPHGPPTGLAPTSPVPHGPPTGLAPTGLPAQSHGPTGLAPTGLAPMSSQPHGPPTGLASMSSQPHGPPTGLAMSRPHGPPTGLAQPHGSHGLAMPPQPHGPTGLAMPPQPHGSIPPPQVSVPAMQPPPRRRTGLVIALLLLGCGATAVVTWLATRGGASSGPIASGADAGIVAITPPPPVDAGELTAEDLVSLLDAGRAVPPPVDAATVVVVGERPKPERPKPERPKPERPVTSGSAKRTGETPEEPVRPPPDTTPEPVATEELPKPVEEPAPPPLQFRIEFQPNDFQLPGGHEGKLDQIAQHMAKFPRVQLLIVGNAEPDETQQPANLAIARANRVKMLLANRRVSPDRITLDGNANGGRHVVITTR